MRCRILWHLIWVYSLLRPICPNAYKFFSFRVDPFSERVWCAGKQNRKSQMKSTFICMIVLLYSQQIVLGYAVLILPIHLSICLCIMFWKMLLIRRQAVSTLWVVSNKHCLSALLVLFFRVAQTEWWEWRFWNFACQWTWWPLDKVIKLLIRFHQKLLIFFLIIYKNVCSNNT